MKRKNKYPLSLLLAVIPLVLLNTGYKLFKGPAESIVSTETAISSLSAKACSEKSESNSATSPVRWIGSKEQPVKLAIIGSSASYHALKVRYAALGLSDVFVETINLSRPAWPIDRYPVF